MKASNNIIGIIHVGVLGRWRDIFQSQIKKIRDCGLWDKCEKIYVGISGELFELEPGLDLLSHNKYLLDGEIPTLLELYNLCKKLPPTKIFYIHTKGASFDGCHPTTHKNWSDKFHGPEQTAKLIDAWREYLEYFVIERHSDCLEALNSHDVCGAEWKQNASTKMHGKIPPHFSGNFWWSNSTYISSLKKPFEFKEVQCSDCDARQPSRPTEDGEEGCWQCRSKSLKPIVATGKSSYTHRYAAELCFIGNNNPKVKCFHKSSKNCLYKNLIEESEYKPKKMDVKENLKFWTNYNWIKSGREWSEPWGTPDTQWKKMIFPRVQEMLSGTVLEIAPGFGRWTKIIKEHCDCLVAVDLCPRCIDHCREIFKDSVELHVNDGRSLPFLSDESIDFVFSFDSMVHCEMDVIRDYLKEFYRVMKVGSFGFIHHSNMYQIPWKVPNGRRASSVGAHLVKQACGEMGLNCIKQEIVNWRFDMYNDCFTTFKKTNEDNLEFSLVENFDFSNESQPIRIML